MPAAASVAGLGVTGELAGDLPDYFLEYLARYFEQYYEIRPEGPPGRADLRVRVDLSGGELDAWRSRQGRPLGLVPLDLVTRGDLVVFDDGSRCAFAQSGAFAVAQEASGDLALAAVSAVPAILQHFVIRIDVAMIATAIAAWGFAPVHAAAVRRGDAGLLVVGPKGAGKTTLSLALATLGAAFVSNELVLVRRDGDGVVMYGTPVPLRLGAGTLRSHPRLMAVLDPCLTVPVQLAPSDWSESQDYKLDVTVRTIARALGVEVSSVSPLTAVVWPRISEGRAAELRTMGREEADVAIASSMLLCDAHWLGWSTVGFNGLAPLPDPVRDNQRAVAELPNYAATGGRDVQDLTRRIFDILG